MEQRIGNYTILRELARGGMGVVFVARQDGLDREVALKLHLGAAAGSQEDSEQDARARERFDREAQAVARLRHPHVIQVHEFGHHRGAPFLAMDLIQGESLEERLGREGAQDPRVALQLLAPVAEAVAYAHSQGILHRDIKPANILIDQEGRPYLTDFGLARDLSDERDRLTRSGQLLGTPYYMAPEAASGSTKSIDARTDVYALGAVLFQTLTGEPAFVGESLIELLRSIVSDPATPPSQVQPGIPPELDAVVLQCLEKEPQHRYADASELAADLARFTQGEPVSASRSSLGRGLRRISTSRAWLAIPLLVALAVLGWVLDRAWLAPARAADAALTSELAWQRENLHPTLYGLDPRHPLELNPGDLRKRLDELDQLPETVDPALRLEARAYLAAYTWLLERSKGRRRHTRSIELVAGRPDVAARAVVLAESGDFAGAQRLLAEALPDTPALRATELALQARHEPARFLASGPSDEDLSELKEALLPTALQAHFDLLLSDGVRGGQEGFSEQLQSGQELLSRWGERGRESARAGLSRALAAGADRYARLERLDLPVALERLDRLRASWHSVSGCEVPQALSLALKESQRKCLDRALKDAATGPEAELAFDVDACLILLGRERHAEDRYSFLVQLTVAKQRPRGEGTWNATPRAVIGVVSHDLKHPHRALRWLKSMLETHPTLAAEIRTRYPNHPLTPFLPVFERQGRLEPAGAASLAEPLALMDPYLLWVLRQKSARYVFDAAQDGRWSRSAGMTAITRWQDAMEKTGPPSRGLEWLLFEVRWYLASLAGSPDPAREAFARHVVTLRELPAPGVSGDELAHALIRLAAVSGPERGEALLQEAMQTSAGWTTQVESVRASWR